MRPTATSCSENPAFGVPAKYYFAGCPFAGMTEVIMKPPNLIALIAMLILVVYLIYYLR